MEQTWEEAAAALGLEITEWGFPGVRKKPTQLAGTVNGFPMTVETHKRDWSGKTSITDYVIRFTEPIGPAGFKATWQGGLGRRWKGTHGGRRVGNWILAAEDPEALEGWLSTPLPDHLSARNAQRGAVFEKLEKVTSNTVMTSQNLTTWLIAAHELTLQRGVPGNPAAFTNHVQTAAGAAEALSI